jgi:hypothetical protein
MVIGLCKNQTFWPPVREKNSEKFKIWDLNFDQVQGKAEDWIKMRGLEI